MTIKKGLQQHPHIPGSRYENTNHSESGGPTMDVGSYDHPFATFVGRNNSRFVEMIATMFKYVQFHPNKLEFQNNPKG